LRLQPQRPFRVHRKQQIERLTSDIFDHIGRVSERQPEHANQLGPRRIIEIVSVDGYVQRRQQQSAEASPEDHVKAPPDLIDDDVTKSEPNATTTASPQPDTPAKKLAEPVLDEHGKPLPVSDIRYIWAMRDRNLAQQKKNQGES
jgi:hypothetical protein